MLVYFSFRIASISKLAKERWSNMRKRLKLKDKNRPYNLPIEIGGRQTGREPTRYGDWEYRGKTVDF